MGRFISRYLFDCRSRLIPRGRKAAEENIKAETSVVLHDTAARQQKRFGAFAVSLCYLINFIMRKLIFFLNCEIKFDNFLLKTKILINSKIPSHITEPCQYQKRKKLRSTSIVNFSRCQQLSHIRAFNWHSIHYLKKLDRLNCIEICRFEESSELIQCRRFEIDFLLQK